MDAQAEASALPDSLCVKLMQNVRRGKKGRHAIGLNKVVNIPSRVNGGSFRWRARQSHSLGRGCCIGPSSDH
ncbi:hypothetical protein IFM47457_06999 [Aspergillus lentulus]|nr:hypothetical protein IFM47457_06999 [Aspergillus lentulus]